jgi:5-methylcytosine-specific restriction endonuclease McrA
MKKPKQNYSDTLTIEKLLTAQLLDSEPDRATVKYPKIQKWHRARDKTTFLPTRGYRTKTSIYWDILRQANRCLTNCEECHSDYRITVHHKDGNCFNNQLENLSVLCWTCHKRKNSSEDSDVVDDAEGTIDDA